MDEVLEEIGADERPRIEVLNKADQLAPERRRGLAGRRGRKRCSSRPAPATGWLRCGRRSRSGWSWRRRNVRLRFGARTKRAIAGIYTAGRVLTHEVDGDDVRIEAEIPARLVERYRERLV